MNDFTLKSPLISKRNKNGWLFGDYIFTILQPSKK